MATTKQVTVHKFDREAFSLLQSRDLLPGGQMVGEQELTYEDMGGLSETEGLLFLVFNAGATIEGEINMNELLYVTGNNDGTLLGIYSPAIWKYQQTDDTGAVIGEFAALRVGSNSFKVMQEPSKLVCGDLTANSINFSLAKNSQEESYLQCSIGFKKGKEEMAIVEMRIDAKAHPTKTNEDCMVLQDQIQTAFADGEGLFEFLMTVGSGGGTTYKMHELGIGQFPIVGFSALEINDEREGKRTSYVLELSGGDSVWAKGNSANMLKAEKWRDSLVARKRASVQTENLPGSDRMKTLWKYTLSTPVTLEITDIQEAGKGFSVAHRITEKMPVLEGVPVQASLMPAKVQDEAPPF